MLLKFLNGEKTSFSNCIVINRTGTFFLTLWAQQISPYFNSILSFFKQLIPTNLSFLNFFKISLTQQNLFINTLFSELNWFYVINNTFSLPNPFTFLPYYISTTPNSGGSNFLTYVTNGFSFESLQMFYTLTHQEGSGEYRFQRLQNPIFRYDFKLGNYMPDENKKKSPFLYTTIHDLTTGVRKSP
jgi:hypothetical protein